MKVSFHGAAQDVTGSCHLVEVAGKRILVDCGLFQGSRELNEENAIPFGFDARAIDFVLLTHAHLDHCGRLPLLVKRGFRGEIIATAATGELARIVMLDSANLQEEAARPHGPHGGKHSPAGPPPPPPLYTIIDTTDCIAKFGRTATYEQPIDVCPGVKATFYNAGHILGSSSVLIESQETTGSRKILFSGDLGGVGHHFLLPAKPPASADVVVMETTYGDRLHRPFAESLKEFYDAVKAALARGGNVVIPTFALERAQEILYFLRQGVEAGQLPAGLAVYLDSPMAISATQIFERHRDDFDPDVKKIFDQGKDPFSLPGLHFTRDRSESMAINTVKGAIIMAGSGMASGGRILHHLLHNLSRKEASIIFVGYAAAGTVARRIIDGAKEVRIRGEQVQVHAEIHTINGFSAHADQAELLAWQGEIAGKRMVVLVHGEQGSMQAFAGKLTGKVVMPKLNDEINLD